MKHPSPEPPRPDPEFADFIAGIVEAGADPAEDRWPEWVRNDPVLAAEARDALELMKLARSLPAPAASPAICVPAAPAVSTGPLAAEYSARPWYAAGQKILRRSLAVYLGAAAAIIVVLLLRGPEALGASPEPDRTAALAPVDR